MIKATEKKTGWQDRERERQRKIRREASAALQLVEIPKMSAAKKRKRLTLEADPESWIWEMFGPKSGLEKPLTRKFTSDECEMIGGFAKTVEFGGQSFTIAYRGGAKTTHLRSCISWGICTGKIRFEVYFCENDTKAKDTQDSLKHLFEDGDQVAIYYPEICIPIRHLSAPQAAPNMRASGYEFSDQRKKFVDVPIGFRWSSADLIWPRIPGSPASGARFVGYGLQTPPRGLNKRGVRPDHVSIDDPDNPDTKGNAQLAKKMIDFIQLDIGGLGGEGRSIGMDILCTLPHQGEGVAYRLSDDESPFVVKRFTFMREKPQRMDLWKRYMELRQKGKSTGDQFGRVAHAFYVENQETMDAGVVVANPWRHDNSKCPDGSQRQLTAIQAYFDDWADKGERYVQCELDSERVEAEDRLAVRVSPHRMMECVGTLERRTVDSSIVSLVGGIDIRKTEIHQVELACEKDNPHVIIDYNIHSHGNSETTVQQAERLILENLRSYRDHRKQSLPLDENGMFHSYGVTLVDKGWMGNWNEEGETKTWASQPVETFCMESGLRYWLPAKGQPAYRSPAPSREVIIGDRWHINRGEGKERVCSEVIWDADHWHLLVEELFMLDDDHRDRFVLFIPRDGIWKNHKAFGEHITLGSEVFKESKNKGQRSRKPRFVRDHWWDSVAMALVAQSVEMKLRERKASQRPKMSLAEMAAAAAK